MRHAYATMVGESYRFYHFINIANAISNKIGVSDWDTASADQLEKRTKIQDTLSFLIDSKVITSKEGLFKTITKITV